MRRQTQPMETCRRHTPRQTQPMETCGRHTPHCPAPHLGEGTAGEVHFSDAWHVTQKVITSTYNQHKTRQLDVLVLSYCLWIRCVFYS